MVPFLAHPLYTVCLVYFHKALVSLCLILVYPSTMNKIKITMDMSSSLLILITRVCVLYFVLCLPSQFLHCFREHLKTFICLHCYYRRLCDDNLLRVRVLEMAVIIIIMIMIITVIMCVNVIFCITVFALIFLCISIICCCCCSKTLELSSSELSNCSIC